LGTLRQPPDCTTPLPWDDALAKLDDVYSRYPEGKSANYQEVSADEIHANAGNPAPNGSELESSAARRARITWASEIEPQPVVWAWRVDDHGRIPAGSLSIAAGREGTGKSSFGIWQSAQITNGLLPGSFFGAPRRVLYVAIEDSWKYTLVPRLIAAGADLSKVGRFEVVTIDEEEVTLSLPLDNSLLEREIVEHEIALVVIDPIMSVISDRIDTHITRDVRRALDPLAKMADRTGAVILGIAHFNKASGTDAATLLSGSHAFRDVPRLLFGFARDDSDGTRAMTQVKNSLGRDDLPSLSYSIETVVVDTKLGPAETGKFAFTGESDRSVADVLRESRSDGGDPEERRDAASWIKAYLAEAGGTALVKDVLAAGKVVGYAEQTLKNARRKVADTDRSGFGCEQVHRWILRTGTGTDTAGTTHKEVVPAVPQAVSVDSSGALDDDLCPSCDQPFDLPNPRCSAAAWHGSA
jgi:AAA domain